MMVRWLVAAPLIVAVSLLCAAVSQNRIDALKENRFDEELLYLPNEKLLTHFTGGFNSIVADMLWLKCIQYTAREFRSQDHKFTWLEHMSNTVVRLDPYFTGAYQYGGALLAAIDADEAGLSLLKRGIKARPDRWELPFEAAKIFVLNRKDDPGSPAAASYLIAMTAELVDEKDRDFYVRWAYNLQLEHDLTETGRRIWEDIYKTSDDKFMRDLAEQKLQMLQLHDICKQLTPVVKFYATQKGRLPGSIGDLEAAGYIAGHPEDPLGGRFIINSDGVVESTTLLDAEADRLLRLLRLGIRKFQEVKGRNPKSLKDLGQVIDRFVCPKHPYKDREWHYDPETGTVE